MTDQGKSVPMDEKDALWPPARILLATDLTPRSDRPLDRSAQLAGEWKAELVALNVLNLSALPDQALAWASGTEGERLLHNARKQLLRDLSDLNVRATARTAWAGDVANIIRDVSEEIDAGLVVTGVTRGELTGVFPLGSTVARLARLLSTSLLVVRARARAPYRRVIIATDFSETSREALQAAVRLFPRQDLTLYHAHELPLSGLMGHVPPPQSLGDIERECAAFMAESALPPNVLVRPVIEQGPITTTLPLYVRENEIDLVMMGAHGRRGILSFLLGSTAAKLLDWLPCDAMVVRARGENR